ncbi:hypothetical protein RirG_116980 [Rhizophagus irregularis DAOM 197198w]|nr:hypothetical protein RirG_116980 [Rhizophagus irregularis DAOM 197198w]
MAILTKVFEEFVNLPNLHINFHLCLHARTYATLRNTQVGIKETVHKIFKSMVPNTNRKEVDLDLLKRYNTSFAIRHLTDDGIDKRFSRSHDGYTGLKKSACEKLFNNWFVTKDRLFDETDYIDEKRISLKNIKEFVKFFPSNSHFKTELSISYNEIGLHAALINSSITWYEMASYVTENAFGNKEKVCLKLGDVFEEINQNHVILKCPLFRLLSANDQQWRRIFLITVIDQANKIHFVRNEIDEQEENEESCWIKNEFYFTAV